MYIIVEGGCPFIKEHCVHSGYYGVPHRLVCCFWLVSQCSL